MFATDDNGGLLESQRMEIAKRYLSANERFHFLAIFMGVTFCMANIAVLSWLEYFRLTIKIPLLSSD
jgi:hypothetical protein